MNWILRIPGVNRIHHYVIFITIQIHTDQKDNGYCYLYVICLWPYFSGLIFISFSDLKIKSNILSN